MDSGVQSIEVPKGATGVAIDFAEPLDKPMMLPALVWQYGDDGKLFAVLHVSRSVATMRVVYT